MHEYGIQMSFIGDSRSVFEEPCVSGSSTEMPWFLICSIHPEVVYVTVLYNHVAVGG